MMKKTMKKRVPVLLVTVILVLALMPATSFASKAPLISVENKLFVTPNGEPVPYINKDQRTMGSLRLIANVLGVADKDIVWHNASQTATLTKGEHTVSVTVGKSELSVNGQVVLMDTKAEMKEGRVFIPARFIGEALGMEVGYDSESRAVLISSKQRTEQPTNNIEEVIGFTVKQELPLTTTVDGLEFTLHGIQVVEYDSEQAREWHEQYNFNLWNNVVFFKKLITDLNAYILQFNITITNKSTKAYKYDENNRNKVYTIYTNENVLHISSLSYKAEFYDEIPNTDMINFINLAPGETLTGYTYTFINDEHPIEYLDLVVNRGEASSEPIRLAERK